MKFAIVVWILFVFSSVIFWRLWLLEPLLRKWFLLFCHLSLQWFYSTIYMFRWRLEWSCYWILNLPIKVEGGMLRWVRKRKMVYFLLKFCLCFHKYYYCHLFMICYLSLLIRLGCKCLMFLTMKVKQINMIHTI